MQQKTAKSQQQMGERVTRAIALADAAAEDAANVIERAAAREAPKKIAYAIGISDEGVRKIRDGERKPSYQTLFRLMYADPEVARIVEHYARRAQEPSFFEIGAMRSSS